jgi:hypothetical protein
VRIDGIGILGRQKARSLELVAFRGLCELLSKVLAPLALLARLRSFSSSARNATQHGAKHSAVLMFVCSCIEIVSAD